MSNDHESGVDNHVLESIAVGYIKSVAGQPAMLSNLAFSNLVNNVNISQQNALSNQQAMNQLGIAVTGKVVNVVANLGPLEAASVVELFKGDEAAKEGADLNAADDSPAPAPAAGDEAATEL